MGCWRERFQGQCGGRAKQSASRSGKFVANGYEHKSCRLPKWTLWVISHGPMLAAFPLTAVYQSINSRRGLCRMFPPESPKAVGCREQKPWRRAHLRFGCSAREKTAIVCNCSVWTFLGYKPLPSHWSLWNPPALGKVHLPFCVGVRSRQGRAGLRREMEKGRHLASLRLYCQGTSPPRFPGTF